MAILRGGHVFCPTPPPALLLQHTTTSALDTQVILFHQGILAQLLCSQGFRVSPLNMCPDLAKLLPHLRASRLSLGGNTYAAGHHLCPLPPGASDLCHGSSRLGAAAGCPTPQLDTWLADYGTRWESSLRDRTPPESPARHLGRPIAGASARGLGSAAHVEYRCDAQRRWPCPGAQHDRPGPPTR